MYEQDYREGAMSAEVEEYEPADESPRSPKYRQADLVVRRHERTLRRMGVEIPADEVLLPRGEYDYNPETWVNEAETPEEREERYQLVDAVYARELVVQVEAEAEAARDEEEVRKGARRVIVKRQGEELATQWDAARTSGLWYGETGEDFDPDEPEPEPCYLQIEPGSFAFPPGFHYLYGPRSSAKTWLAYFVLLQEIRRGNRVLLIDLEMDKKRALRRLHALGATRDEISDGRLVYVHPSGAISDAARVQLLRRFADCPPAVIVIDSSGMATGASGLNSNDDADMAKWALDVPLWMKSEWLDACVLVIDHLPKSQASGGATDPIGSQRKGASADGLYEVRMLSTITRRLRGKGRVTVWKDRSGFLEEGAYLADFEFGGGGPFEVGPPDTKVQPLPEKVVELLDDQFRIAVYVGDKHPDKVPVETARSELGIRGEDFTRMKDLLVSQDVLIQSRGLGIGPRYNEWIADQATDA